METIAFIYRRIVPMCFTCYLAVVIADSHSLPVLQHYLQSAVHPSETFREKRDYGSHNDDNLLRQRIVAALDKYFGLDGVDNVGFTPLRKDSSKRNALELDDEEIENQRHSKKKELIHGKVEFMKPMDVIKQINFEETSDESHEMAMMLITDDLSSEALNDETKMMIHKMVDSMLSNTYMKSVLNQESALGVMKGHSSDLIHEIGHPMVKEFTMKNVASEDKHEFVRHNIQHEDLNSTIFHSIDENKEAENVTVTNSVAEARDAAVSNHVTQNSEPQFTTLEIDLGPAILPLRVPEGYFVPFVPRKAFGVVNGVARPPHGHASFYMHRPAGLVDVPNSPAFGFLFSGQTRAAEIQATQET